MKPSGSFVLLAVPTRGAVHWATVTRLEQIRDKTPGLRPILYQQGNISVALTRNRIVKQFLASDCDTLVMVDDDVVPPPRFLQNVLPLKPGYGIVGIPYPMVKDGKLAFAVFDEQEDGFLPLWPSEGLHECDAVGTGCVAISRAAIEAIGEAPFRVSNDPDDVVVGEDLLFCRDVRDAGLKVGYYWDEWFADHLTSVGLAPLMEAVMQTC